MHTRELPSGRAVATVIPLTDVACDAATVEDARARAIEEAEERLPNLPVDFRADLSGDADAELETLALTLSREHGDQKLPLTLSVVLVRRQRSAGEIYSVSAPGVPRWSVAASDRADALALAARALEETLANWAAEPLMALDARGVLELQPFSLPFEAEPETGDSAPADPAAQLGADDLTALAAAGQLGRLDRRDPLVERVLAALAADGRASVLLVGPGDVGKSALTHEVAARLASGDVPPALRNRRLIRLSANELVAGARYTGMWQDRARRLVAVARRTGAIIAMGDPQAIVDAGRWSESDNNLSRVLRPYMERGELRLICEATEEMVAAVSKREPSFVEAFHRIDLHEPDPEAAREILRAAARRMEVNHEVEFLEAAVDASLDLTRRFEPYRALPGKAVRLLEETAQLTAVDGERQLGREEVARGFAQRTGLPLSMLSDEIPLRAAEVRAFFEERVLGQQEAVEAMVDLIAVVKAALGDPTKPLGTLFLVGPTGVGKTELCKALAEYLFGSRDRVLRFDMGEYASGDAAPRLTGTAWDRHSEGELTRRVREQPFCVILLDEIEKAHPTVFDVLLPALGEGRLTDAAGRTADLRNAIVIMTSNLGVSRAGSGALGFADSAGDEIDRQRNHFVAEAERFFRPEFFNRIDRVLAFAPLDQDTIARIARREVGRLLLREGITRRQLLVEIDDEVITQLASAGFHPRYGARPLHREIERAVIQPLARLIVEELPDPGDLIRIRSRDDAITVAVHRVEEPAPATAPVKHTRDQAEGQAATTGRAVAQARAVLDDLDQLASTPEATAVSAELSQLLTRINQPGFWDEQEAARATMNRIYQLQRINDKLHHLRSRAEGLLTLTENLQARRDRSRLSEARAAITELEDNLSILRLTIAGAASGEEEPRAILTITPVGSDTADWAATLTAMYTAWANRTGREVARAEVDPFSLEIIGPGSLALLRGEAGLHRRERSGPDGGRQLARVTVNAAPESPGAETNGSEQEQVVRVYTEGARTGVRDPRTSTRVGNLAAVLDEGRIDDFILAIATQTTNT
jgi:ATP-dependent Clp protease ATP-binding subunit ClpA